MNRLKTTLLLGLLTGLLVVAGGEIGGKSGMTIALFMAFVMNFVSYWFSDKIVLSLYGAREVGEADAPEFYRMIRRLATNGGLPMPRVYIIPSMTPNAFATGRNPSHAAVAATEGILQILSKEELEGVMAHELAHVKNRDTLIQTVAATIGGAITYLAQMAQWGAMFGGRSSDDEGEGGGVIGVLFMAILAPIAAMLIQMAISRSREFGADAGGAAIAGNPLPLASALKKLEMANHQLPMHDASPSTAHLFIVNPLTGGGLLSLFSTHPPIAERVRRLEEMAGRR
ncbi:MAG: zinc metalloprotease HtpX [Desulfuromonadia bacterium]